MLTRRNACIAMLGAGAASKVSFAQNSQRSIDDFLRDFTDDWVRINPDQATSLRYFTGPEQDRLERQLTPLTLASARQRLRAARKGLAELRKFDRTAITETQRVSAQVMAWQLEMVVAEEPYWDYMFPLEQMNGWNVSAVEWFTVARPLSKPRDAENYLAALGQVSVRMEEAIALSRRLAAKNVLPPRFIIEATLKQIQNFLDPSPGQNPFVTVFADKIATVDAIPVARREQLCAEAEKIVGGQIYPSWKKAAAILQSQLARSTNDAGLWRLKGGAEAYAFFLRRYTTTNLTADQIHEIGLQQVARIETRMDALLRQLGRTAGPVKERIAKLKLDLQYPNPKSEESREQIMRDIDAIIRDAEKRAALLFDLRPKAPVVARPFPRFREANAAANYNAPAPMARVRVRSSFRGASNG